MSVAKYIEEYKEYIDNRVNRNIIKAEENPYLVDEIKAIMSSEPESAIAKVFNENGYISENPPFQLFVDAASEDRELFRKLKKGANGLKGLDKNKKLLAIDPASELESLRKSILSEVSKLPNFKINDILNYEPSEFSDFIIHLGIDTAGVSGSTIQAALKELSKNNNDETEEVNTLNPDDIIDDTIDSEDPLNGDTNESTETDAISEVTETAPELERESTLNPDEITIDEAITDNETATESSAINLESGLPVYSENEEVETASTEVVESTPSVEAVSTEVVESTPSVINDIDNITNATTNVENQNSETINGGAESIIDSEINQSSGDVISNSSELTKTTPPSDAINSSTGGSSGGSGYFDDDLEATSAEDLALLRSTLGMSDIDESNSIINELTESTTINSSSPTLNNEADAIIDEAIGDTEVMKEKIGIDKKIAPINTPKSNEIEKSKTGEGEDVKLTEVKSETPTSDITSTNTDASSNVTNNENTNSENNNAGYTTTDMSGVEARLRKIEMLLSGPLEVKIVE